MEHASIATETARTGAAVYPDDLDITVYDDGRWNYASSYPDPRGGFREVYLVSGESGWQLRLFENIADPDTQGVTKPRWTSGLAVGGEGSQAMTYGEARISAETWLRGGEIYGIA